MSVRVKGRAGSGVRRMFALAVGLTITALLMSSIAFAGTTPQTCDSVPKYYCAKVEYVDQGSYVDVLYRWYWGARDDGATRWQRFWMADWSSDGSQWVLVRSWGEGLWYDNYLFNGWHAIPSGTITQPAAVNLRIRFENCCRDFLPYFWCSPQLDHYLYNNTSAQVGTGTC